jgi:hypothetical protein
VTILCCTGCQFSGDNQARVGCAQIAMQFLKDERAKFEGSQFEGKYKYNTSVKACLVDVRMVSLPEHWESHYIVDLLTNESLAFYAGTTGDMAASQEQRSREAAFRQSELRLFGADTESIKSRMKLETR